ncbi:MAG: MBL fold metallo-hydrolase, partial [Oscillospiraceae bacterium]|nr:MBL fold metallo-hydrolase [Oscillospiraceae bacterium]
CAVLTDGDTHILIDAGTSARYITCGLRALGLSPEGIAAVVVTHDHTDHISALPRLLKTVSAPVYAPPATAAAISAATGEAGRRVEPMCPGGTLTVGGLTVRSFRTPHDAADSVGYVFTDGHVKLSYATDTGCVTEEMLTACLGADLAVIEANHDRTMLKCGRYPQRLKARILSPRGHLSNDDSGDFAVRLWQEGAGKLMLAHLSEENNTPAAALRCVGESLMLAGAVPGRSVELVCAPARCASGVMEVTSCSR